MPCRNMFENGTLTEHSGSYIWQEQSIKKHIFNAYYNGKVGQLGIEAHLHLSRTERQPLSRRREAEGKNVMKYLVDSATFSIFVASNR